MGRMAVAIINWNTRDLLRACLQSALADGAHELVVIDNGSSDGSAESAVQAGARVLHMGANLGFAAAVNRGIAECRTELTRYQAVEGMMAGLRQAPAPGGDPTLARAELESRLADLRSRLVRFGVFETALGPILIGASEQGVSVVEYLSSPKSASAKLARAHAEAVEDRPRVEGLFRELAEYLEGRRTRLDWPLDLRLSGSEFQRRVLQATSGLPFGAVRSYASIAREIGAACKDAAFVERLNKIGVDPACGTPAEFAQVIRDDLVTWKEAVQAAGMK